MKFIGAIVGLFLGASLFSWSGVIPGAVIGLLVAVVYQLGQRVTRIEAQIGETRKAKPAGAPSAAWPQVSAKAPTPPVIEEPVEPPPTPAPPIGARQARSGPSTDFPSHAPVAASSAAASASMTREYAPDLIERGVVWVKEFFTSGNVVVKVGAIVLFFGVGFLLKYAVEHNKFPIELRLAGAALGALVLLVVGWRLRERRRDYALVLQGAGIGILYLTVFAAAKLYGLLPLALAFGVMAGIVVLSGVLAVLQNAKALAVFGATGGFLAPVLVSTGAGNHVMLFSYYALLNAGILGIAWFRAWRELNVLGFLFTFVIGALWGHRHYQEAFFATTEPFLILFFLFYVAIAVLFAHRQTLELRGYVDGTIVFGVPVVAFGLQWGLVRSYEYGLAISALVAAAVYIGLATALWRRQVAGMRLLTEAFLALGVVFGSLAIPLALDGNWTAAVWALEGAAIVWVGTRQDRALARAFGLLLQFGATLAFFGFGSGGGLLEPLIRPRSMISGPMPAVFNATYLGSVMIAVGGLLSSFVLMRGRDRLRSYETGFDTIMLVWGAAWWFFGGLQEIGRVFPDALASQLSLIFIATSVALAAVVARWLDWRALGYVPIGLLPVLAAFTVAALASLWSTHPFAGWGAPAWIVAFAVHYTSLLRFEADWPRGLVRTWHAGAFVLLVALLSRECAWFVQSQAQLGYPWNFIAWAIVPIIGATAAIRFGGSRFWPSARFHADVAGPGLVPVLAWLVLWSVAALLERGGSYPLPYIPVANPVDLGALLVLVLLLRWTAFARAKAIEVLGTDTLRLLYYVTGVLGVLWLSAVVGRAVHFWGGVPYTAHGLFKSVIYQAALTMTWSTIALVVMVFATRRALRLLWMAGAALLGVVVVKLFIIDLTGIGTIERIVSFVGVGVLMLIVGYFSPLPPRQQKEIPA
ncbi:MAG: DUF2339 domain-containing protein [Sulfuricaulis sp.]|nr:DUF2339 domain-containing protein [Sulfuricaulis sp.]